MLEFFPILLCILLASTFTIPLHYIMVVIEETKLLNKLDVPTLRHLLKVQTEQGIEAYFAELAKAKALIKQVARKGE